MIFTDPASYTEDFSSHSWLSFQRSVPSHSFGRRTRKWRLNWRLTLHRPPFHLQHPSALHPSHLPQISSTYRSQTTSRNPIHVIKTNPLRRTRVHKAVNRSRRITYVHSKLKRIGMGVKHKNEQDFPAPAAGSRSIQQAPCVFCVQK
jgi:hypothetical protein